MGLTRLYDRWDQLDLLFKEAMTRPAEEVDAFCRDACGDDTELHGLLRDMVNSAEIADEELRGSISELARDVASEGSLTGERVGAYRLDALLGRGGMGEVYLASRADGEFEKKVAVKIVRSRLAKEEFADHTRTERQVMANLNHASIPTLVDAGQLPDGRPYFICDYVDGVSIDDYCEQKNLSTTDRLKLLNGVGEALQHAHNNLVLHLDIKPDNVLVQPDGTPSLLDFGVAKLIGQRESAQRGFSPRYASPEQIRGEPVSVASDVFSLGALMYQLLAGKPPFSAPFFAPTETIMAERAEFVERLDQPDSLELVDADLRAIVGKAMADTPSERYASVDSFLRDLEYYRSDLPVSARDKTYGYRLGKYARRHTLALSLVVLAFAVLAAFGLREADLRRQAQAAQQEAEAAYRTADREAETARQVSSFLVNIFEVSDPSESRGSTVTARELLDKAAGRVDDDLTDQPLVAAKMKHTMGRVYSGLGLHTQATPMLEKALALRETADDTVSVEHADVLQTLGKQYDTVGRHADARRSLNASLEIRERELGLVNRDVAESLIALGRLNTLTEDFDEAEQQLLRALAINEEILDPNDPLLALNLRTLAFLYSYVWRNEDAEKVLTRAVAIEETHGSEHIGLAISLSDLGDTLNGLERYQEAIVMLERVIEMWKTIVGPDHPRLAKSFQGMGLSYLNLKDYDRAEEYLLKALEIRDAKLGPMHPATGFTVGALGSTYTKQGRLEDAQRMLTRSLAIMREVHPEEHGNVSFEKYALAEVHRKRGQLDEAERLTLDAIENWLKTVAEDDENLLDGQWQLAHIYRDQGRNDEAFAVYQRVFSMYEKKYSSDDAYLRELAAEYGPFLRQSGRDELADALETRMRQ